MKPTHIRIVEIRAAEGGEDARLFVADLALAYMRLAHRKNWKCSVTPEPNPRGGHQVLALRFEGKGVDLMDREAGAQRLQRVPPTERSNRVHTSTVTVSVLKSDAGASEQSLYRQRAPSDFKVDWYNGTIGAGGQHHQKNATCCRLTHLPTGLVKTSQSRSRQNSQQLAMAAMLEALDMLEAKRTEAALNGIRKAQVGSGERAGVKRRTWRFQDDTVQDHVTGVRARATDVMRGRFELLFAA